MSLVGISYRFFGDLSNYARPYFIDINEDLHKANMNFTLEEYVSVAMFITFVTFAAEIFLFVSIFALFADVFTAFLLGCTLSATVSALLFFLFYTYPSAVAKSRANKIRKALPFAAAYMTTIASSRLHPITIFKTLSKFREYGEVSAEARSIVNDVELFGMNFSTALKKRAKKTPSQEFAELLWGLHAVVISGGDIPLYLKNKTNELMNDYRRRIRKYAQDLSVYVEIYMTLIITGSIFFIVLSSTISLIAGTLGTVMIQTFVVLILLPLLSIAFILITKGVSPTE